MQGICNVNLHRELYHGVCYAEFALKALNRHSATPGAGKYVQADPGVVKSSPVQRIYMLHPIADEWDTN